MEIIDKIHKLSYKVLELNHLPTIRVYIEIFILKLMTQFPEKNLEYLMKNLETKNLKTQLGMSLIWVYKIRFNNIYILILISLKI